MIRLRQQHRVDVRPGEHFPKVAVSLNAVVAGLAEFLGVHLVRALPGVFATFLAHVADRQHLDISRADISARAHRSMPRPADGRCPGRARPMKPMVIRFAGFSGEMCLFSAAATASKSARWITASSSTSTASTHPLGSGSGGGAAFFEAVWAKLGHLPFIAEDLGIITPDVVALRDEFELPGIRVFQFGFDANPGNPHLTHNYVPNTVAYTGTHDNNTTRGWFKSLPENARQAVRSHAGTGESFPRNSRFESPNHVDKCMLHMQ
jgi:hypothetical protein